jgi:hypothetical protein
MGGRMSRNKGSRTERLFAKLIGGNRVPLSGSMVGYKGDVRMGLFTWECKARAKGFTMLYNWLIDKDGLALKADNKEWLIVIPERSLEKFIKEYKGGEE